MYNIMYCLFVFFFSFSYSTVYVITPSHTPHSNETTGVRGWSITHFPLCYGM